MGRTIPSFTNVLAMEKAEWKEFDDMFDIPRLYLSACSNSVQLVPLHPIIMSILFHHYKELKECVNEFEQIEKQIEGGSRCKGAKPTITALLPYDERLPITGIS